MTTAQLPLIERGTWEPPEPPDFDTASVLAVLRDGKRDTRDELVRECLLADRTVRACIETLRRDGWPIASASDARGYALTWDDQQLDALERDLRSRALSALRTRNAIRRARRLRAA